MGKFFELHRKELITGAGTLIFIIAGALAMSFMPSDNSQRPPNESQTQTQNTNQNYESKSAMNQEVKQEPQMQMYSQEHEPAREIYVYITGAVNKPGVYNFPEGSRIFQVIEAAGGFTPKADIAALNLADTFTDAQHIHIPVKGERPRITQNTNTNADTYTHITVQPQNSQSNAKSSGNGELVDVNNASESELQRLTGVGPAIAKRIYEYRQKNGRFKSAEELVNVRGIGPAKLEKMRSQILIR